MCILHNKRFNENYDNITVVHDDVDNLICKKTQNTKWDILYKTE